MKRKSNWQDVILALIICIGFAVMIVSCSKDQAEPKTDDSKVDKVTYENFAASLFQSKCSGCHMSGGQGAGKWVFNGYSSVKNNSSKINNAVLVTGSMPLGGSLSASEKEKLNKWFNSELPEQ